MTRQPSHSAGFFFVPTYKELTMKALLRIFAVLTFASFSGVFFTAILVDHSVVSKMVYELFLVGTLLLAMLTSFFLLATDR